MIGARRLVRWTLALCALMLPLATTTGAESAAPTGPRLAVVKETRNPLRLTLLTVGPDGDAPRRLAGGEIKSGPPWGFGASSWRPDGAEVAFAGAAGIELASADGSAVRAIAAGGEGPVFAPDGHTLAFTREARAIWAIDLLTGSQRLLMPRKRGVAYFASSFSPDGSTLLATRVTRRRPTEREPVAMALETGRWTRLLADGLEPIYSPDGSKVVLLRHVGKRKLSDLFVLHIESGRLRRLTSTPHRTELLPSWDPSGERIAFVRVRGRQFESPNAVVQINADGTCETVILKQKRTAFSGPAWQPGPGREAGRIEC